MTVTIPALMRARRVLAMAPEARKAAAVAEALDGPLAESCPASILRRAAHATLYLDAGSAGLIAAGTLRRRARARDPRR
jgi:glucosamine-6-phosphate deaminase